MSYSRHETDAEITLEPHIRATASVIWLHGLGADGYDFVPIVDELQLPSSLPVRFVFPHASPRPVTINNGYIMRAWYDITSLSRDGVEDEAGIRTSENVVYRYIEQELASGIDARRIVVAGFSQGGAIALHTALRYENTLAGVLALSTYLPLRARLTTEAHLANRATPILMCHGRDDTIVPVSLGELSRNVLTEAGYRIDWRTYAMEHAVCPEEIDDISRWLQGRLTTEP
jgi:phospholipase/carboxylesterase